jgi:hypothetical protein
MLEVSKGRIGEHLACAAIELNGWQTINAPARGFDLIVIKGDCMLRCQVKASTYHRLPNRRLQFHFGVGGKKRRPNVGDYDFAACVSIPHRRVFFLPIQDIKLLTLSTTEKRFADGIEQESFNETMEKLHVR